MPDHKNHHTIVDESKRNNDGKEREPNGGGRLSFSAIPPLYISPSLHSLSTPFFLSGGDTKFNEENVEMQREEEEIKSWSNKNLGLGVMGKTTTARDQTDRRDGR